MKTNILKFKSKNRTQLVISSFYGTSLSHTHPLKPGTVVSTTIVQRTLGNEENYHQWMSYTFKPTTNKSSAKLFVEQLIFDLTTIRLNFIEDLDATLPIHYTVHVDEVTAENIVKRIVDLSSYDILQPDVLEIESRFISPGNTPKLLNEMIEAAKEIRRIVNMGYIVVLNHKKTNDDTKSIVMDTKKAAKVIQKQSIHTISKINRNNVLEFKLPGEIQ